MDYHAKEEMVVDQFLLSVIVHKWTLSLLPIPPCVHHPGKAAGADLPLQKGNPAVEMSQHGVIAVKGMTISPGAVCLSISIR